MTEHTPIFRRKIYDEMLAWKSRNGRSALLIEGARRVGKSTIVEEFAKNEYRSYIIIDFSLKNDDIEDLFKNFGKDRERFFRLLQRLTRTKLHDRDSLIVFDEVQSFPLARQTIKHLVADGRYDYIETGSLISIKKNVKDILIPSEETSILMHPMDFEEFLWATGDDMTADTIRESFRDREPLGPLHRQVMELYTTYMLVGGMPQAVEMFITQNNFASVEEVKRDILDLYGKDAVKINSRRILNKIASLLSRHEKTFSPTEIREGSRTRDYLDDIDWLRESRMVNVCFRTSDPGPAPGLNLDENSFKLYLLDTGLLVTSALSANIADENDLYERILKRKLSFNKGMLFENMVAQELTMLGHELVFAKFKHRDSKRLQEVDFILARGEEVIPLECKSGTYSEHRSLDRFMDKYSDRAKHAYVIHSKDLTVKGDVMYIPIYMTMCLRSEDV